MDKTASQEREGFLERKEKEEIQGLEVKDHEDRLDHLVFPVTAGREARARPVGPGMPVLQGDRGIQEARDHQVHLDTVTRTPAWDTTWEFKRTIGMIIEDRSTIIFFSSYSSSSPSSAQII